MRYRLEEKHKNYCHDIRARVDRNVPPSRNTLPYNRVKTRTGFLNGLDSMRRLYIYICNSRCTPPLFKVHSRLPKFSLRFSDAKKRRWPWQIKQDGRFPTLRREIALAALDFVRYPSGYFSTRNSNALRILILGKAWRSYRKLASFLP